MHTVAVLTLDHVIPFDLSTPIKVFTRTRMQDNLPRPLALADMSAQAGVSTRTLIRRFSEQTGTTPLLCLHRARIRQAQHLLQTTHHTVERIAAQVGFGSPTAFRDRFKRTVGVSPHTYRRSFS